MRDEIIQLFARHLTPIQLLQLAEVAPIMASARSEKWQWLLQELLLTASLVRLAPRYLMVLIRLISARVPLYTMLSDTSQTRSTSIQIQNRRIRPEESLRRYCDGSTRQKTPTMNPNTKTGDQERKILSYHSTNRRLRWMLLRLMTYPSLSMI